MAMQMSDFEKTEKKKVDGVLEKAKMKLDEQHVSCLRLIGYPD